VTTGVSGKGGTRKIGGKMMINNWTIARTLFSDKCKKKHKYYCHHTVLDESISSSSLVWMNLSIIYVYAYLSIYICSNMYICIYTYIWISCTNSRTWRVCWFWNGSYTNHHFKRRRSEVVIIYPERLITFSWYSHLLVSKCPLSISLWESVIRYVITGYLSITAPIFM